VLSQLEKDFVREYNQNKAAYKVYQNVLKCHDVTVYKNAHKLMTKIKKQYIGRINSAGISDDKK